MEPKNYLIKHLLKPLTGFVQISEKTAAKEGLGDGAQ